MKIDNNFANKVVNEIKSIIGDMGEVECREVEKNNGIILHGVTIKYENETIVPTVYIENFIDIYSIREIAKEIIAAHVDARKNLPQINPEDCMDITKVIDKLCLRLVNFENNKELLTKIPYQKFYDMAIIFVIELSNEMSIKVTNEMMNNWNKHFNFDFLFETAKSNTRMKHPEKIQSMIDIMAEITGMSVEVIKEMSGEEIGQHVVTNPQKMYGATCLTYDGILDKIACVIKGDFAIIPSSIHEIIVQPVLPEITVEELNEIISEINETQVPDQDILSNHAYIYRVSTGKLEY